MLNFYIFILFVGMIFGLCIVLGGNCKEDFHAGLWLFAISSVLLLIVQILL